MAISSAGDALSPGWRYGLAFVHFLRRWTFVPMIMMSIPLLVVQKGGDALNVSFNTVAVLFLLEIDNVCCEYACFHF